MTPELRRGERIDELQFGGYRIIQNPATFCFGTDAVLLADFAAPKRSDRAVDLGCGNGVIAILMAAHCPELQADGVEIQPEIAEMAGRSVRMNGLEERLRIHCMDMREAHAVLGQGRTSLVVCNPPYGREGAALVNPDEKKRIARHETGLTAGDVARSAAKLLKFGGRFCVIYPAGRAFEMMTAMQENGLAPKRIRTIHSRAGKAPKLVLMDAVKGGGSMLHWLEPLILYNDDGTHSAEWRRIYGMDGPAGRP